MRRGYARVSTRDQSLARQVDALEAAGCDEVWRESASGADFERPVWRALDAALADGDELVVLSVDRLGRSYDEVLSVWRSMAARGVRVRALDMPLLDRGGGRHGAARLRRGARAPQLRGAGRAREHPRAPAPGHRGGHAARRQVRQAPQGAARALAGPSGRHPRRPREPSRRRTRLPREPGHRLQMAQSQRLTVNLSLRVIIETLGNHA